MNTAAKILIVDDNQIIHEILEKLFASRGENAANPLILHADNGQVALDILTLNPDIDVIVLDLDMPIMNGFEFLALVKGNLRFRAIPVCVFSGSKDDSIKALKLGAGDYINKPGDYQEIKIRVFNLIENKWQSEAAERAKRDFLATISHELRTPMNGVLGMTQLLQTTELTAEQAEYLELLEQSATGMMTMVNNVISFLGSENPIHDIPVIPFSIRTTLQESIDNISPVVARNGVRLESDIHHDIPEQLTGLPDKIQLIFQHILSNAVKFSPSGKVVVSIKPGAQEKASIKLQCSVIDTGIGIPPERLLNIFEPFTQVDGSYSRNFDGLGIGLSIASRMVQMMGGSIHVESSPGGGSKFSFALSCGIDSARSQSILTSESENTFGSS